MKTIAIALLRAYQRSISPDHSWLKVRYPYGFCRFYPSCSAHAMHALKHNSFPRALLLIGYRLLHCNPFTKPTIEIL